MPADAARILCCRRPAQRKPVRGMESATSPAAPLPTNLRGLAEGEHSLNPPKAPARIVVPAPPSRQGKIPVQAGGEGGCEEARLSYRTPRLGRGRGEPLAPRAPQASFTLSQYASELPWGSAAWSCQGVSLLPPPDTPQDSKLSARRARSWPIRLRTRGKRSGHTEGAGALKRLHFVPRRITRPPSSRKVAIAARSQKPSVQVSWYESSWYSLSHAWKSK